MPSRLSCLMHLSTDCIVGIHAIHTKRIMLPTWPTDEYPVANIDEYKWDY